MRAALLYGPGDLRIEDVPEPEGEVLVAVEAATSCATDVKCLLYGHRILGPYPARFGHETVGLREDTGARVLVGDSVACKACAQCTAGRTQLCERMTWVLGGFAERIAAPRRPKFDELFAGAIEEQLSEQRTLNDLLTRVEASLAELRQEMAKQAEAPSPDEDEAVRA
ncbi:MAG: alcohol dehydrogenase catalytic domain-containing protein, partial [Actinobacteria bacterium]|nr:alcohol dehydrogenase catalytic domain-containing protein [Actinomycetota bacterium]